MDDGTAAGQTLERQLSRSWNRNGEAQMRRELQIISCFGQVQCQIGRLPWTCLVDGTFPRGRDIHFLVDGIFSRGRDNSSR
jgi:hypothetical protein